MLWTRTYAKQAEFQCEKSTLAQCRIETGTHRGRRCLDHRICKIRQFFFRSAIEGRACAIKVLYVYPVRWTDLKAWEVARSTRIGRTEFVLVEVSNRHTSNFSCRCDASLLRHTHSDWLVKASSTSGQEHGHLTMR